MECVIIRHYLICKSCSQYFFIGACIRGVPIYRTIDDLRDVNLDNMWGHHGSLYNQDEYKY
jgi:hypothetical protein